MREVDVPDSFSTFGFAHCCDRAPEVGLSTGHFEAKCPMCNKRVGVYGGWLFLRRHWNCQHNGPSPGTNNREQMRVAVAPQLDGLPAGWRSAQLDIQWATFGHTRTLVHGLDCVFYTPRSLEQLLIADGEYECGIGDDRHLYPLTVAVDDPGNAFTCTWNTSGKRYPYSYAYASRWSCTDGTWGLHLQMTAARVRDGRELDGWIKSLKLDDINGRLKET